MTPEELARLEQEVAVVSRDFKAVEASYGETVLHNSFSLDWQPSDDIHYRKMAYAGLK